MNVELQEVIVSYDVSVTRTRTKLFKKLKAFGLLPLQKSVFWGRVLPAEKQAIRRLFDELLDKKTDSAFIMESNIVRYIDKWSFNLPDKSFFEEKSFEVL